MKKILSIATLVLISIAGILLTGCDKEQITQGDTIKYGTSFGMCVGYRNNEITVSQSNVKLVRRKNSTNESKTCNQTLSNEQWQQITGKIDVAKFNSLNKVYGCPDSADGGAEWIEVQQGGKTHKVTFEYHNEPDALKGYIADLRRQMAAFTDCK